VNDVDCFLANFWRSVTADPDAVAVHADWPVNEADMHARHQWLIEQEAFRERMHSDPDFFDVKIAGWWVWGLCQWIGGGWCAQPKNRKHPKLDGIGKGVHSDYGHPPRQLPDFAIADKAKHGGRGIHAVQAYSPGRRPELSSAGRGVHLDLEGSTTRGRPRPNLNSGQGIHMLSLGNDRGLHGVSAAPCAEWFRMLQARLRRVRVACGDWKRVLGPSVLGKGKNVGGRRPCAVFLDPPYSHDLRSDDLYRVDAKGVAAEVAKWALEHGDDPDLRIALCGYADEHEMPGWTEFRWKAARGYAGDDNDNRERETIWFSPHCLPIEQQRSLFDLEAP